MPNHVTNQIEFYGNQKNINKVFELIKGDNGYIDFNKIIPMPKSLNIESGSNNHSYLRVWVYNHLKKYSKNYEKINLLFDDCGNVHLDRMLA